nr:probable nucleoside diphosphate kinase 5 [Ipomoea batatas]
MIKPDGILGNYSSVIKETINNHGFSITQELFVQLNEDTVKSFYAEHSLKSFFPSLIEYMTSGPVLIMALEKGNAIDDWRALIGPTDPLKAKATHPHRSTSYILSFSPVQYKIPMGFCLGSYHDSRFYHFQYQSHVWAGCAKKLCSWFRLTPICCPRNIFFL